MKKKIGIPIIVIAVLIILAVGYYFMPKTFGKNVNPSEVDHINVFDGNTGTGFTITNPEDIKYIVENIQSHPMKKDGISLDTTGYSFKIYCNHYTRYKVSTKINRYISPRSNWCIRMETIFLVYKIYLQRR